MVKFLLIQNLLLDILICYGKNSLVRFNGVEGWVYNLSYKNIVDIVEKTNLELPTFEDFTVIESPNIPFEEVKEREEKVAENVLIDENVVTENIVVTETEEKDLKDDQEIVKISVNAEQIVSFGVVAAVVITLTCIVTIVLINKTYNKENKSDKEEIKTENKE